MIETALIFWEFAEGPLEEKLKQVFQLMFKVGADENRKF